MTDATRGLARYECRLVWVNDYETDCEMRKHDSGDWVRYEDAARIQRARARNLVRYIRERIWSPPRTVVRRGIHAVARWESQRHAVADRIAAKYVRELPVLFSDEMVRAILDGRKTQTRRLVKPSRSQEWCNERLLSLVKKWELGDAWLQLEHPGGGPGGCICAPWSVGDRLWVREAWARREHSNKVYYRATPELGALANREGDRWRPSIHMPRWASRLSLEVVSVRVERLHDITEEDAKAEGVIVQPGIADEQVIPGAGFNGALMKHNRHRFEFYALWDRINGDGSWDENPIVWVIEFRRVS